MEKIKDFIYDKNDILVALLILVLAALLIMWQMDVIMDYPETIFAQDEGGEISASDDVTKGDDSDGDAADTSDGDSAGKDSTDYSEGAGGGDTGTTSSLWKAGALTKDVEVDVYGNSATAAIQCLVDAGLFKDYDEYKSICDKAGMNHEKVSAGTLLFEKGFTKEDVARKINWS